MKKLKYSLTALALVVLAACNKDEMPGYLSDPDAVRIEAAVGALTKSNPLGDAEKQKTFNDGDRIAVSNAGKTVVYKLQNGTWAPENSSEYLKWDKSDLEFTAKYPADYSSLPADQSTKVNLVKADHMEGRYTCGSIPSEHILSMVLERKNVLVKIKIAGYLDQYKEGETYIKNLRFNNVQFPLIQDKDGNYKEGSYTMGTVGCTYTAILEPNNGAADAYFVEMILHKSNQEEGPLKVKGIPELKAGCAYTFNLYIGKNSVKIGDVTVKDWTTGGDLPDGETDAIDTWDGQTVTAFATKDANGKDLGDAKDNPILIKSCAELAYLAKKVYDGENYGGKFFKLADDLNLADQLWAPIGLFDSRPFSGIFDGDGHEIMGLRIDANPNRSDYLGLFGYINGSKISNLKISSAVIKYNNRYGAILCGVAENSQIENCSVSGKVSIENDCAGGVVAELRNNSSLNDCTAEVQVSGSLHVGGLCGSLESGNISGCIVLAGSTMNVSNPKDYPHVGGLVGTISKGGAKIKDCDTYAKVCGLGYVGGAFGHVDADGGHEISNCNVYGDVSVNVVPGHITDAYQGIGGFIGYLYGGTSKFSGCGFNGTVGTNNGDSFPNGSVYGAFIGLDKSNATFTDCWYNADKVGELSSVGTGVKDKDYTGINAKNLGK